MADTSAARTRHALLFGGSGQIGQALLDRLCGAGWRVTAVSREPQPARAGVDWRLGGFEDLPVLPLRVDAVFSAGPLDRFSHWYRDVGVRAPRVVAFGSTSVDTKGDSVDAAERDVARRLVEAEAAVLAAAHARGAHATLLRPTLVYGCGRDATLSRVAALAARWRVFPLPEGARGLRQPVHVEDLAAAAMACVHVPASYGKAYALPGGEALAYRDMIRRVLASLQPPAYCLELPPPLFQLLLGLANGLGMARGLGAAVPRMREDLVFDARPAMRDFGYAPRPFEPEASMFRPMAA
ncbi:nucleoside-diphosphate sugar epimerase [Lysobacter sp. SG-8]|uniref:Nucleoside-diphosphate sugar epimerase n=1 Tax=Marilutibacter penaei TaxID=2759900 RepID=A0A7W3U2Y1_9GAMM|nr:nucleoside-diphosphate sugar epimerase [Lysobacter penaei]MBB1087909.1 nucleoside-diphosphate sugar epimerase [Lysobacter penaei]